MPTHRNAAREPSKIRGLKEQRHLTEPINSTKQARRSCKCSTERPVLPKKTADTHWKRRKGSRISCARLKIGLRSWKRRSPLIRRAPSGLSSGSIASTQRLKIDFFSGATTVAR